MQPALDMAAYQRATWADPVGWMHDALDVTLWDKQADIAVSVQQNQFTAVRSANGIGKTYLASALALWYPEANYPSYSIVTSASHKNIDKSLLPTIRSLYYNAKVSLGGDMQKTQWVRDDLWGMFTVSPNDPENFSGFRTSGGVFIIVDEASALTSDIYDAIMGLATGPRSRVLMIGNPLIPHGPFFDSFKSPLWAKFQISAMDSPNVQAGKVVIPGIADKQWLEARRIDWGEGTPQWQARVLGEFPEESDDTLITLAMLQHAADQPMPSIDVQTLWLGFDVARYGDDKCVCLARDQYGVREIIEWGKTGTMETTGKLIKIMKDWDIPPYRINIDVGMGQGVIDRMRELGYAVNEVNFGSRASDSENFQDERCEMYWGIRDALDPGLPGELRIPAQYKTLHADLACHRYTWSSTGRKKIEEKDAVKRRLGRSPDHSDALALTYAKVTAGTECFVDF